VEAADGEAPQVVPYIETGHRLGDFPAASMAGSGRDRRFDAEPDGGEYRA
jgi:hypothetical protein